MEPDPSILDNRDKALDVVLSVFDNPEGSPEVLSQYLDDSDPTTAMASVLAIIEGAFTLASQLAEKLAEATGKDPRIVLEELKNEELKD